MTQIRIFEGAAQQIQKNVNTFLAQNEVRYVDIKYQVAGSNHQNASAVLVYEKLTEPESEKLSQGEPTPLQSVLAIAEHLDEISEQVAERLGLNK